MDEVRLTELEGVFAAEGARVAATVWISMGRSRERDGEAPSVRDLAPPESAQQLFELLLAREHRAIQNSQIAASDYGYAFAYGVGRARASGSQLIAAVPVLDRINEVKAELRASPSDRWTAVSSGLEDCVKRLLGQADLLGDDVSDRAEPFRHAVQEVTRLAVPLTASVASNLLDDQASRVIDAVVYFALRDHRAQPWRRYDTSRHQRVVLTDSEVVAAIAQLETDREEARLFFSIFGSSPIHQEDNIRARAIYEHGSRAAIDRHFAHVVRLHEEHLDQERRERAERLDLAALSAARLERLRLESRPSPRPAPQRYGVSPEGAEAWVCDMLRWLGVREADVTRRTGDGGVDVLSDDFAVSVKHYSGSVPVEEVREIFGVAASLGKRAMLWTSGRLTSAGVTFASMAPVDVVRYDVSTAEVEALTPGAEALLEAELHLARTSGSARERRESRAGDP